MQRKLNVWDYVVYISLLVLTIWVLLKITGIIQTPLWLEYGVPILCLIFTAFGFYQNLLNNINEISINLAILNTKFSHLDKDVEIMKRDLSFLKNS